MQKFHIDADTWGTLNRLLDEALDQPATELPQWLDQLAPQFEGLKPRLRALLSRTGLIETGEFLQTLPKFELEPGDLESAPAHAEQPGDEIGPYRLVRELGSGGMGVVWLAERTDGLINRAVALKLPHGAWKRAGLAERMAREREILATLTHPNIAHLYDAGVTGDGQPYLAIEFVEGLRIDIYCRQQDLDVPARLRLFKQVAEAVAYAHGKLVVHRDLKPANILVSAEGQVRLLDFGIAKLLDEGQAKESRFTELSGRALTPDYASPEQILGEPLTVASDVYSLGVVLYELLGDRRPYKLQRDSRGALEDAIVQAEPAPPSSVVAGPRSKSLRGDLDTIVLKALKKKPSDRYPTAHALLDDIERFLRARPVLARPDSRWYRARKFVARNKLAVSAAGAILIAVLAGAGIATWQARLALDQSQRAEAVKNFIASIFSDADPQQSGSPKVSSAVELLHRATPKIEQLQDAPAEVRVELRNVLGGSLLSLDDAKAAEAVLRVAVAESTSALGSMHARTLHARRLLARAMQVQEKLEPARAELSAVLPLLRQRAAEEPDELVAGLLDLARMDGRARHHEDALAAANEALEIVRTRLGDQSPLKVDLLLSVQTSYRQLGRYGPSKDAAFKAYKTAQAMYPGQASHPKVVETRFFYGGALEKMGQLIQACEEYRSVFRDTEALVGPQGRMLGIRLSSTAPHFVKAGYFDEALRNAVRGREILLAAFPQGNARFEAATAENVGLVALTARGSATAIEALTTAVEGFRRDGGPTHENVMDVQRMRSLALAYAGRMAEAEQAMAEVVGHQSSNVRDRFDVVAWVNGIRSRLNGDHRTALRLQSQAFGSLSPQHVDSLDGAAIRKEIALNRLELGEFDAARDELGKALAIFEARQAAVTPDRADALVALGRIELATGAADSALAHLTTADSFWRNFVPTSRWAGEAALWLGRCYLAVGRRAEAQATLDRAARILARSPMPGDVDLLKLARVSD